MEEIDLTLALERIKKIAHSAGEHLLNRQKELHCLEITHKEEQGVASSADYESEQIITEGLKGFYPQVEILGEESAYTELGCKREHYEKFQQLEYAWVVDPLDGTNNFLNGWDYFSVCIGLVSKGYPVLGLVYHPINATSYWAIKNHGSWMQKRGEGPPLEIKLSDRKKPLSSSLLVTGFLSEKGEHYEREFDQFKFMMQRARGVRRLGSAALDLCLVARSCFDAFWERGLAPWDVAAAGLIAQEAGAKITDYNGEIFQPFQHSLLAASPSLHEELLNYIK